MSNTAYMSPNTASPTNPIKPTEEMIFPGESEECEWLSCARRATAGAEGGREHGPPGRAASIHPRLAGMPEARRGLEQGGEHRWFERRPRVCARDRHDIEVRPLRCEPWC